MAQPYDAVLVVSFGGPEGPDDVIPFLENVLRGRNVPRERMLEVAQHYQKFGGVSPLNQQNRDLIAALEVELEQHGPALPIYWGNRNWRPMLPATADLQLAPKRLIPQSSLDKALRRKPHSAPAHAQAISVLQPFDRGKSE